MSAKENAEFDVICNNLKFDEKQKRWSTSYLFIENLSVLRDNYGQAMACMRNLESQLTRQKRMEEFNLAFQDIVDRGVFKELTSQDMRSWEGPVNYISIVCAFKQGPHQSTPLRLCMNSSMKQPPPVSKSLNDLLMKGPPALADLFSVTVGMRESKYALAKDISKFYNSVDADPVAQHTRRVVWRFGDQDA